ncbi:hypothetical protein SBRCBS47491_004903 [Sporothrix bragantina]|uniref:Uncharacterized protein n=1 Tax=Sporothrix bragantina TaxID=671064 RepID=A0ABP0BT07_9PEZI
MAHSYAHDFDPSTYRGGYIPGTDYASPYLSRHTVAHPDETAILRHVNCSLLSTPGVPPTLLALKQHAQSLSYLVAMLSPHGDDSEAMEVILARTTKAKENTTKVSSSQRHKTGVSAAAATASGSDPDTDGPLQRLVAVTHYAATDNPFDWLDLSRPYTKDTDPEHHRPLLDLVNEVQKHHDVLGTTYHCPLTTHTPRNGGRYTREDDDVNEDEDDVGLGEDGSDKQRPYTSHHNLLMHANMCLERLDHEYAGTGGLISLLPTISSSLDNIASSTREQGESTELAMARNTLVGQWLAFTQQLVGRMHELEATHANAVHFLCGEVELAPTLARSDHDSSTGPTPCPGRWVLTNAGDDVWTAVHDKLDEVTASDAALFKERLAQGVVGERSTVTATLPYVDFTTRFYRASADSTRGPISVCLAGAPSIYEADITSTETSAASTVAANQAAIDITPKVPLMPASALEKRYNRRLEEAGRLARDNTRLAQRLFKRTQVLSSLRREHARVLALNAALEMTADNTQSQVTRKSKGPATRSSSSLNGATRRPRRCGHGPADSTYQYLPEIDGSSEEE